MIQYSVDIYDSEKGRFDWAMSPNFEEYDNAYQCVTKSVSPKSRYTFGVLYKVTLWDDDGDPCDWDVIGYVGRIPAEYRQLYKDTTKLN